MTKITPFVKWAGGKRQLLEDIRKHIPTSYNRYFEPFLGGGAVLFDIQPEKAVINDINKQLINVYKQLKHNSNDVISIIKEFEKEKSSEEFYYSLRKKYNQKITENIFDAECAGLFIWINKHCFNGLYRVNSKGLFNVPFNGNIKSKSMEIDNLKNIGKYLKENDIKIYSEDFENILKKVKKDDFVFIDSPYVPLTKTAGFIDYSKEGFSFEDHLRLSELFKELDKKGAKLILTNNDTELVRKMYEGFKINTIEVNRSINRNGNDRKGKEVMILNY